LVRIKRDGHDLTLDWPAGLDDTVQPVVSGSSVTYPQVLPDVDLVLTVNRDATGFSEVLVVNTPEAAQHPALQELTFPVQTSAGLAVEPDGGGFIAMDAAGEDVFTSPTPLMWDSSGDSPAGLGPMNPDAAAAGGSRAEEPIEGDKVASMPAEVSADAVTIIPSAELVADPEVQYPIFIDPSVTGSRREWVMIQSAFGGDDNAHNFTGDEGVGLCDVQLVSDCVQDNRKRLIWEFENLTTVAGLNSEQITKATFSVYGVHSYACSNRTVQVYHLPGISGSTTWNSYASNFTSDRKVTELSVHHKPACNNVRWIEFNVMNAADNVADGDNDVLLLGLRAKDESTMSGGWKRYRYDARLSFEYNRYPNTPSSQHTTVTGSSTKHSCAASPGPVLRDSTPTLNATISDPDGGNVSADFLLETSGGTDVWNPSKTTAKASGSVHSATSTSLSSGSYRWRVWAVDPQGLSTGGSTCYFQIDVTPPSAPPVVHARTGEPAVYVQNGWAGGVGLAGRFYFTNGGVSDIVKYKYSFDSDALNLEAGVISGSSSDQSVDVSFTPQTAGSHTLYVQSVDKAGWTSVEYLYRFYVDFPGENGWWKLDEGAGAAALDATANGNHLTVTGATWVDGPLAEAGADPADKALHFASTTDAASSVDPVVATNKSFTVMAMVRLDTTSATYTAVSQDGEFSSGFKLGHVGLDSACTASGGNCWRFSMITADSPTSGVIVRALAPVEVAAGEWVHLTGVYDASTSQVALYVCDPYTGTTVTATSAHTSSWNAAGAFQVGRGQYRGSVVDFWPGDISDVRVFNTALSSSDQSVRDACTPAG
jgi:hypothetical protein